MPPKETCNLLSKEILGTGHCVEVSTCLLEGKQDITMSNIGAGRHSVGFLPLVWINK